MITTAYNTWQDLLEIMTKEKATQIAVVWVEDEKEWHYSRPAKFVIV